MAEKKSPQKITVIIPIRIAVVILCAELLSVMIHQTVSYNKIKMEHYFCGERFPVVPRLTVYYHKIKMKYYYCYLLWIGIHGRDTITLL
jgi:NADH:ubiquinone oxidoreductase subunit 3 (subunit A)